MASTIGANIRAARESVPMEAQQLARLVGLSPAQMSLIESGSRKVSAQEAVDIAAALGVSPLALLEPDSLPGRVAVAARAVEVARATSSDLITRLMGIADLASLVDGNGGQVERWSSKPATNILNWRDDATRLAEWARDAVGEVPTRGDIFVSMARLIEEHLGIDVLVEAFHGAAIGGSIIDEDLHLIAVSSELRRSRAMFTLAHELGHVFASDGSKITCDADLRNTSPSEKFANAFAAAFLLPPAAVRDVLNRRNRNLSSSVLQLMLDYEVSRETAVYRLHNLGYINAGQRDALISSSVASLALQSGDGDLKDRYFAQGESIAERCVLPTHLLGRLIEAFWLGEIGAAPIASLIGREVDDTIAALRSVNSTTLSTAPTARETPRRPSSTAPIDGARA